ncbi:MAG: STAS domain-containing protein [Chlamydiales bacterium]|nr:STAS domain-containing protein [Chlamydiales bacterium]
MSLKISIEEKSGKKLLRIDGRLDATSSPLLEEKLKDLISHGSTHIAVDFAKLDYLSSAGMRLMLSNSKKLKAHHGNIAFFSINEDVMEIIKMAGFEKILTICSSEAEAIAAA